MYLFAIALSILRLELPHSHGTSSPIFYVFTERGPHQHTTFLPECSCSILKQWVTAPNEPFAVAPKMRPRGFIRVDNRISYLRLPGLSWRVFSPARYFSSLMASLRVAQQQEREEERPQGRQPQGRRSEVAATGRTGAQVTPQTMASSP